MTEMLWDYGFHVVTYKAIDGSEVEEIWNARHGGCPALVMSRARRHVILYGSSGVPAPDHVPAVGDRVWIDLTPEAAMVAIWDRIRSSWSHGSSPMCAMYDEAMSKGIPEDECQKDMAGVLFRDTWRPGVPQLITVTDATQIEWLLQANAAAQCVD